MTFIDFSVCDQCHVASAFATVRKGELVLSLCGHHLTINRAKLESDGWDVEAIDAAEPKALVASGRP